MEKRRSVLEILNLISISTQVRNHFFWFTNHVLIELGQLIDTAMDNIFIKYFTWFGDCTAQKMKFSINDFFSQCDQMHSFLRIWSHLLKKSWMEDFIFCAVLGPKSKSFFICEPTEINHKLWWVSGL